MIDVEQNSKDRLSKWKSEDRRVKIEKEAGGTNRNFHPRSRDTMDCRVVHSVLLAMTK